MSAEDPKNADNRQDLPQPEPAKPSVARRWRYFTRRHAILAGLLVAAVAFVLIVLAFFLYRLGYVDRYIANQIKRTFSNYGIRAEIREFHADIPPRTVTMSGVELYDAATGEKTRQDRSTRRDDQDRRSVCTEPATQHQSERFEDPWIRSVGHV